LELLLSQVFCGVPFEEVLVSVGAEVISIALVVIGQFGVLIDPQVTNGVLDLPLLPLREKEECSKSKKYQAEYYNSSRPSHFQTPPILPLRNP
jgi:hypothetical protein